MTTGSLPSITETQELVVPRSIPIIFPIFILIYTLVSFLIFPSVTMFVPLRLPGDNYENMSWQDENAGSHGFNDYDKTADRLKRNWQNGIPYSNFVALQMTIKMKRCQYRRLLR
jgi:hypothetical protein